MEKTLIFQSVDEIRLNKLLRFIIPTYLTALFTTVYTIVDGIFVSAYVGTNALAAINVVYPLVNILYGIALAFATGGSALAALHIGGKRKEEACRTFSVSMAAAIIIGCVISAIILLKLPIILQMLGATTLLMTDCKAYIYWWLFGAPIVVGKEMFTYFIRVDGSPTYSFLTALSGGLFNIVFDYIFIGQLHMGITGAALATFLGLLLSFVMGVVYFLTRSNFLCFTRHGLSVKEAFRSMINGTSEFVNQLAIAITTVVFNRSALIFAGENGVAAVSIIMYLQFLCIGIYFGFSMGLSTPLGYAYGDGNFSVCRVLEKYAYRFFAIAPIILYGCTYLLAPIGVLFFASPGSTVFDIAVSGLRLYGLGFLFSGINIFAAIRMMTYGKGYISGMITFLRSFALLLLFLTILPRFLELNGIWLAVPAAEILTLIVALWTLRKKTVA